jgi:hypothetical protein
MNLNKAIPFGEFTDKILQSANETFSTLHARFLKKIWGDNNQTRKLHHNQVFTDWQNGRYEAYIPTRDNTEFNLSHMRIAIQVQPLNSNDSKHQEAYDLSVPIKEPLGCIESELLILIAPHQDRWGLVKGFKHRNKPGYFTAVFTNKSPEIVWKRVLDHIMNFIGKRMEGFMRSLNIETASWKWTIGKRNDFISNIVLEKYSFVLRQTWLTFKSLYEHFLDCMHAILREIGENNVALHALREFDGLSLAQLGRVFSKIREGLNVDVEMDKDALKVLQIARSRHG